MSILIIMKLWSFKGKIFKQISTSVNISCPLPQDKVQSNCMHLYLKARKGCTIQLLVIFYRALLQYFIFLSNYGDFHRTFHQSGRHTNSEKHGKHFLIQVWTSKLIQMLMQHYINLPEQWTWLILQLCMWSAFHISIKAKEDSSSKFFTSSVNASVWKVQFGCCGCWLLGKSQSFTCGAAIPCTHWPARMPRGLWAHDCPAWRFQVVIGRREYRSWKIPQYAVLQASMRMYAWNAWLWQCRWETRTVLLTSSAYLLSMVFSSPQEMER